MKRGGKKKWTEVLGVGNKQNNEQTNNIASMIFLGRIKKSRMRNRGKSFGLAMMKKVETKFLSCVNMFANDKNGAEVLPEGNGNGLTSSQDQY